MPRRRKSSSGSTSSNNNSIKNKQKVSTPKKQAGAGLLSEVIQRQRAGTRFTCDKCGLLFYTAQGLSIHHKRLHLHAKKSKTDEVKSKSKSTLFACIFCEESRSGWNDMLKHKQECRDQHIIVKKTEKDGKITSTYQCKLCEKFFKSFQTLREHVKLEHAKDRFKCRHCGKNIFFKENIAKHEDKCKFNEAKLLKKKIFKKKNECKITEAECKIETSENKINVSDVPSDITFNSSDEEMTPHNIFKCTKCTKRFILKTLLEQHIEKEHKEKHVKFHSNQELNAADAYTCGMCSRSIPPQLMPFHLHAIHKIDQYGCRMCNFLGYDLRKIQNHISLQHKRSPQIGDYRAWGDHLPLSYDGSNKKFCRFCTIEEGLQDMVAWYHHMLVAHPQKLLACPKCEKRISTVDLLVEHIEGKHPKLSLHLLGSMHTSGKGMTGRPAAKLVEMEYRCKKCKENFLSDHALQNHTMAAHKFKTAVVSTEILTKERIHELQNASTSSTPSEPETVVTVEILDHDTNVKKRQKHKSQSIEIHSPPKVKPKSPVHVKKDRRSSSNSKPIVLSKQAKHRVLNGKTIIGESSPLNNKKISSEKFIKVQLSPIVKVKLSDSGGSKYPDKSTPVNSKSSLLSKETKKRRALNGKEILKSKSSSLKRTMNSKKEVIVFRKKSAQLGKKANNKAVLYKSKQGSVLNNKQKHQKTIIAAGSENISTAKAKSHFVCMVCSKSVARKGFLVNHVRFKHEELYKKLTPMDYLKCKVESDIEPSEKKEDKTSDAVVNFNGIPMKNLKLKVYRVGEKSKQHLFYCFKCSKSFKSYHGLAIHKGHAHAVKIPIQRKPVARWEWEKIRPKNMRNKKPRGRYNCLLCETGFQNWTDRHSHMIKTHSKYDCRNCRDTFEDREIYMLHKRVHAKQRSGKAYQCDECKRTFSMRTAYTMHKKHHRTGRQHISNDQTDCSRYDLVFKNQKYFPFYCEVCCVGFNWMSDLALHSKSGYCGIIKPFSSNLKSFTCTSCDSSFNMIHSFLHHASQCAKITDL